MIYVKNIVDEAALVSKKSLIVESSNNQSKVILTLEDIKIEVLGRDLIAAINNAMNTVKY